MTGKNIGMILWVSLFLMLTFNIQPSKSWTYNDGTSDDTKLEKFGSRADKLFITLGNETAEWNALANGEIDVTDWPLSKENYDLFTSNTINPATGLPYNETINTVFYGSELDLTILDINNNNNEYLGNPPDPDYPNPVYPNPTSVKEMRQAIAHLFDRSQLDTIIGEGFYEPLHTIVPHQGYRHPDIMLGGALENITYPYGRTAAETLLDEGGFPVNPTTGWRFWDRNNDSIEQTDEFLELKFPIRTDDERRFAFATFLVDELNTVGVRVFSMWLGPVGIHQNVMLEKDFHLYTGKWQLGVDPDHLILWCWDYYWHPGWCYNYAGVKDEEFCETAIGILEAQTMEEVLQNATLAQLIFAENAYGVPLWSCAGSKAMSRYYTGGNTWQSIAPDDGENRYRGQYWEGTVDIAGVGIDNFWSFLNMQPQGHTRGDGENMTIRCGFKTPELKMLNPIYASWLWDWNVLSLIYEPLIERNPYNLTELIPWLAEDFEIGTYTHPLHGECTKIKLKLRSDITWHDGTPLTTADVYFTWVELEGLLREQGVPPPWWCWWCEREARERAVDIKLYDAYNFELLFDQQSIWFLRWASGIIVLPKHVWKPLIETAPGDVMSSFAPDPNLIGSGPWRLKEYVEGSHVLLVANRPDNTVETNLPGSSPVTSPKGYCRYHPIIAEAMVNGTRSAKLDYYTQPYTVHYKIRNLHFQPITVDISITYPNETTREFRDIVISAEANWTHSWTGEITLLRTTGVEINVTLPTGFEGVYSWTHVFYGTIITYKGGWFGLYKDIIPYLDGPDIVGSSLYDDLGLTEYPYKFELPTPDFKIDMKDIAQVARAFGAYPGHLRWYMGIGDINNDYIVDMKDIGNTARKFGWIG